MSVFDRVRGLFTGGDQGGGMVNLRATDGFSPGYQGDLTLHRTVPVVHTRRLIDGPEAEALDVHAQVMEALAESTKQGYKALGRIEKADEVIDGAYREYQTTGAKALAAKTEARTKYGETMQELRQRYGKMGNTTLESRMVADAFQRRVLARQQALKQRGGVI